MWGIGVEEFLAHVIFKAFVMTSSVRHFADYFIVVCKIKPISIIIVPINRIKTGLIDNRQ